MRKPSAVVFAFLFTFTTAFQNTAFANPVDGVVSGGSAVIDDSDARVDVHQSTDRAVIDWRSFDIDANEVTQFHQPSLSSSTLNRINDTKASVINGQLTANGNLYLVNQNGVMFGSGSAVDVNGIVVSTVDIRSDDFMAGNLNFDQAGQPDALIKNEGVITVSQAGLVGFVAPQIENSGIIRGTVHLAAGDKATIDLAGDGLIRIALNEETNRVFIHNSGIIDGQKVILTAAQARGLVDSLIINTGDIKGSDVDLEAGFMSNVGEIEADNSVHISGDKIDQQGTITAQDVNVNFAQAYIDNETSQISAHQISIVGESLSRAFISGEYSAPAGFIDVFASDISLFGARFDASGINAGGRIRIGGDYRGSGEMLKADITKVNFAAALKADALESGDGGEIIVWSQNETLFAGSASAKGGALHGDGGLIEVSSADKAYFSGRADASASNGANGLFLFDPKNITVSTSGLTSLGIDYFELVDPNDASGNSFGNTIAVLSTGNVVVTSSGDDFGASNAGAVYLFNGSTGALISTLRGSTSSDAIGGNGVTTLTGNGHYVIPNYNWDNGAASNAGAATWGSGTNGVSGVVSSANSLVGSSTNDFFGSAVALTNGNYVAYSGNWSDGSTLEVGASAWGNGATGTTGVVSSANALIGSTQYDSVGPVTVLSNGNYVLQSPSWDNGVMANVGAVTWVDGTTGLTGVVSESNSLIGSTTDDQVGNAYALTNGNFVVISYQWDNGGLTDAGAVTWVDGTVGITGTISSSNSLIGGTADDQIGRMSVGPGFNQLDNGNYVIVSTFWDNGGATEAGAVTWGSATSALTGVVSDSNSLVGSTTNDQIGSGSTAIHTLSNGHYLVISSNWDNGGAGNAGAVTWGNGTTGITGAISSANSLVGSTANNQVGSSGVVELTNGHYVVRSPNWDDGGTSNVGAVTWGSGTTGITGAVSSLNSLIGSTASDLVGNASVTALTNGNYVVASNVWGASDVGAVTWGSGTSGTSGTVSSLNSLVGSTNSDQVGGGGVTALTNGNYVVVSTNWDGSVSNVGAVTWGSGTAGITGAVSSSNSLVGSTTTDQVGNGGITALTNGNYVVVSTNWDGSFSNVGAVTWGNGTAGITGAVSSSNSLVGSTLSDQVGSAGVTALTNGNYVVKSPNWDTVGATNAGAVTWGSGTAGITGAVSSSNSLVGARTTDQVGVTGVTALTNGNYLVLSANWDNGASSANAGAVTLCSGTAGCSGAVTSSNSLIGPTSSGLSSTTTSDTVHDRTFVRFSNARDVYSFKNDFLGADDLIYSFNSSTDYSLHPSLLTDVLNTGTALALQANNDITIDSAITVSNGSGDGGDLTLQAGRSILINADIVSDNGDVNLYANEDLSTGVIDAQRSSGDAAITMASGTTINAGGGTLRIRLDDGSGKTNTSAGDITLRDIIAAYVIAQNKNAGHDVVLNGTITASGTGTAVTLSSKDDFINNAGSSALSAPNGRWLTYSTDPREDTKGGLTAKFLRFNCVYEGSCANLPPAGNGFLYLFNGLKVTDSSSPLAPVVNRDFSAIVKIQESGHLLTDRFIKDFKALIYLSGSLFSSITYPPVVSQAVP